MAYNFKKLSDVALQEVTTENTNVYVDENGEIKRISANKFGAVKTVNGASPDESGNVAIEIPEGFSGSWNDLTDKPFYETEVMGDTLTWDGNTEGLVNVAGDAPIDIVKVSDATPTMADLANGANVKLAGGDFSSIPVEEITNNGNAIVLPEATVTVILEDNTEMNGFLFPEKGIYFVSVPDIPIYTEAFTIPGYTGFPTTVVKPIDKKYLPDDVGGGNEKTWLLYSPEDDDTNFVIAEVDSAWTGNPVIIEWDTLKVMNSNEIMRRLVNQSSAACTGVYMSFSEDGCESIYVCFKNLFRSYLDTSKVMVNTLYFNITAEGIEYYGYHDGGEISLIGGTLNNNPV